MSAEERNDANTRPAASCAQSLPAADARVEGEGGGGGGLRDWIDLERLLFSISTTLS